MKCQKVILFTALEPKYDDSKQYFYKKKSVNLSRKNDNIHFSILSVIIVALVNKKPLNIFLFVFFIPGPEEEPLKVA